MARLDARAGRGEGDADQWIGRAGVGGPTAPGNCAERHRTLGWSLGVGECAFGPNAAAIDNGVAHALGARIRDMPFTRELFGAAPASIAPASIADDPALDRALAELSARGALSGARALQLSVRVDPGVLAAATARLGMANPSDVVNASLALAAAPDRFKAWLRATPDRLSDDFRLPE